jgi:hypothetical protein
LLDLPAGVLVTGYERDDAAVRLRVTGGGDGLAIAVPPAAGPEVTVRIGDRSAPHPVGADGLVRIAVPGERTASVAVDIR